MANAGQIGGNALSAQKSAYIGVETAASTGLVRIADQVTEATARVESLAMNLNSLSIGIHGPRPEPVSARDAVSAPAGDSIAARVDGLLAAIDRLQRSYDSIVR